MIHRRTPAWAVAVFECSVALYPDDPNSYDCLAEAHLENGDRAQAVAYYEQALAVDPGWENARKMLAKLQ